MIVHGHGKTITAQVSYDASREIELRCASTEELESHSNWDSIGNKGPRSNQSDRRNRLSARQLRNVQGFSSEMIADMLEQANTET